MEFQKFDKIPRLSRDCIVSEKIDGTNAQIMIINKVNYHDEIHNPDNPDMDLALIDEVRQQAVYSNFQYWILAGSRKRWLDTSSKGDNHGFAKWVVENAEELLKLGEGRHYGEWYGQGIQRKYGLDEKRFALFNVKKWDDSNIRPKCCEVVPVLYEGEFDTREIQCIVNDLAEKGSSVSPGFMNPEGVVIYHKASGKLFKKTILNDEKPKEQIEWEKNNEI